MSKSGGAVPPPPPPLSKVGGQLPPPAPLLLHHCHVNFVILNENVTITEKQP